MEEKQTNETITNFGFTPITGRQIKELTTVLSEDIVYSTIFDYDTLINYRNNSSIGSVDRFDIENQMFVTIAPLLSEADFDLLHSFRNNSTSGSKLNNAIENQMLEVINQIKDCNILFSYRNYYPSGSKFYNAIENQMLEVITPLLPEADYDTLATYWDRSTSGSELEKAIETQILLGFKNNKIIMTESNVDDFIKKFKFNYKIMNNPTITQEIKQYFRRIIEGNNQKVVSKDN